MQTRTHTHTHKHSPFFHSALTCCPFRSESSVHPGSSTALWTSTLSTLCRGAQISVLLELITSRRLVLRRVRVFQLNSASVLPPACFRLNGTALRRAQCWVSATHKELESWGTHTLCQDTQRRCVSGFRGTNECVIYIQSLQFSHWF